VDDGIAREIGERRVLRVRLAVNGGWWLALYENDEVIARSRLDADDFRRVMRGKVATLKELEVRGLRNEIEFRVVGRIIGRLTKQGLLEMIAVVERDRPPEEPS